MEGASLPGPAGVAGLKVCSADLRVDSSSCSLLTLQVVVLCFAVAFGSFFQGYGPYPSATKMALPSQHSMQEPYTASVGKTAPSSLGSVLLHFSKLSSLKEILCERVIFKT